MITKVFGEMQSRASRRRSETFRGKVTVSLYRLMLALIHLHHRIPRTLGNESPQGSRGAEGASTRRSVMNRTSAVRVALDVMGEIIGMKRITTIRHVIQGR
jgi:hypothetical protein